MHKSIYTLVAAFFGISILCGHAQTASKDTIFNQTDKQGQKQGFWKVKYDNGSIKYTGFFKNNKPVGEMRRYFEDGTIKAIMKFDATSVKAYAQLFYQAGPLGAEGIYINSQKDSVWRYYSYYSKKLTRVESYKLGKLHGKVLSYYENGKLAEEVNWNTGIKEGSWKKYYDNGTMMMFTSFSQNKRTGAFIFNYPDGKPEWNGKYENDKMEGKWVQFFPNGNIETTIEYKNGIATNEKELMEKQSEVLKALELKKGKIPEPDETNFMGPRP